MGKRATLTYTSEKAGAERAAAKAPAGSKAGALAMHHCRTSGQAVVMLNVDVNALARRKSDGSLLVEVGGSEYFAKLYASTDGNARYVRLADGRVERRHDVYVSTAGDGAGGGAGAPTIPVGYREAPDSARVYLYADALEASVTSRLADAPLDAHPSQARVRSGQGWSDAMVEARAGL